MAAKVFPDSIMADEGSMTTAKHIAVPSGIIERNLNGKKPDGSLFFDHASGVYYPISIYSEGGGKANRVGTTGV